MQYQAKTMQMLNLGAILLLLAASLSATVAFPTSVLVQNSELGSNINVNNNKKLSGINNLMTKVKRSSSDIKESVISNSVPLNKKSSPELLPASFNSPSPQGSNVAADVKPSKFDIQQSNINDNATPSPTILNKRGINPQQYLYGSSSGPNYGDILSNSDFYSNPYPVASPNGGIASLSNTGIWSDDLDPSIVYTDLQDLDEYTSAPRVSPYRNRAYDNLQNLLNSEAYLEPIVTVPLPYSSRFYGSIDGDHNKRSNLNKFGKFNEMRLKRDTRLTPADMLALVALVEAGERARTEEDENVYNGRSYYPNDRIDGLDDSEDYEYETMPRDHKYGNINRIGAKRYMVAKKKRSLGKFFTEPVAKPSISLNSKGKNFF